MRHVCEICEWPVTIYLPCPLVRAKFRRSDNFLYEIAGVMCCPSPVFKSGNLRCVKVWFHAFSVKSDQGSPRRPKGIAGYVKFSVATSLVIRPKNHLLIDISLLISNFLFFPPPYFFAPISAPSLLSRAISPSTLFRSSPIWFLSPLDKQVLCID